MTGDPSSGQDSSVTAKPGTPLLPTVSFGRFPAPIFRFPLTLFLSRSRSSFPLEPLPANPHYTPRHQRISLPTEPKENTNASSQLGGRACSAGRHRLVRVPPGAAFRAHTSEQASARGSPATQRHERHARRRPTRWSFGERPVPLHCP